MNSDTKLLLSFLWERENIKIDKDINWKLVINFMEGHGLLLVLLEQLKSYYADIIPLKIYKDLEDKFYSSLNHNLRLWKELLQILRIFEAENIDILPFKGMDICTRFYPSIQLRSMVDIDVLVRNEDLAEAEKILCNLGYRKDLGGLKEEYWKKQHCHIAFKKCIRDLSPLIIEVHWGLDFKRGDRAILPNLWSRIEEREVEGVKIKLLSPEDALFGFALNNRRFGNTLSLKQAWDIVQILTKNRKFDWDYVLKESSQGKMQAAIYFTLAKVKIFTAGRILPSAILRAFSIPDWKKKLIQRLIFNNIFSPQLYTQLKNIYLKTHFLIFDNLWEPLSYIINIPYEQLCKFYNLKPYTKKANFFYKLWPLSMPIFYFLANKK